MSNIFKNRMMQLSANIVATVYATTLLADDKTSTGVIVMATVMLVFGVSSIVYLARKSND